MHLTIYATKTCAACHELTTWLDKQDIAYTKKITDEDPDAMIEFMLVNDGMIGVPFTVITDESGVETKISGFDRAAFTRVLY